MLRSEALDSDKSRHCVADFDKTVVKLRFGHRTEVLAVCGKAAVERADAVVFGGVLFKFFLIR